MIPFPMPKLPRWAWYAIGAVVIALAFYVMLDRYGDSRFREGKAAADAAWIAAHNKLIEDAANARGEADANAAAREAEFAVKVEDEKEKIDEAIKEGSSPLDVLFGG